MKKSKILSFLLLAVLCLGFASCSSDDDDNNSRDGIVGTWVFNSDNDIIDIETNDPKFTELYLKYGVYVHDGYYDSIDGEISFYKNNKYKAVLVIHSYVYYRSAISSVRNTGIDNPNYNIFDNYSYVYSDDTVRMELPYKDSYYSKHSVSINGDIATFKQDFTKEAKLNSWGIFRRLETPGMLGDINIDSIRITKYVITRTATRK